MGWGEAALEEEADRAGARGAVRRPGCHRACAVPGARGPGRRCRARRFCAALGRRAPGLAGPADGPRAASLPAVGVNATIAAGTTAATVEAAELAVAAGFRTLKLKAGPDGHDRDARGARGGRARRGGRRRRAAPRRQRDVGPGGGDRGACGRWPGSRCSTWSSRWTRRRWPRRRAARSGRHRRSRPTRPSRPWRRRARCSTPGRPTSWS